MTLYRLAARLAVALAAGATATLPWVDRTPRGFDRVTTVLAFVVAAVMLVSIVVHLRLPLVVVEAAAAVATVLFTTDGAQSVLEHEQRTASIVRTVLFTLAAAVVSLAVMLDQSRRRRGVA